MASKKQPTKVGCFLLAERVGFEPTVRCRITSFQDWLLKPLGHLSIANDYIILQRKCQAGFPWDSEIQGLTNRPVYARIPWQPK